MKLTYWYSEKKHDDGPFIPRAETKEKLLKVLEDVNGVDWKEQFKEPKEMVVEYSTPLDLLCLCMGAQSDTEL